MGHINDLRKTSGSELIFSLLFVSGAVCPGMLTLWNLEPGIIEKSGVIVFILLSVALTLPLLSINALAFIFAFAAKNKKSVDLSSEVGWFSIAASSCITMFAIGIPVLVAFMASLSLRTFSWVVIGTEILALVVSILAGISSKEDEST